MNHSLILLIAFIGISKVYSHAVLEMPPSRNVLWRKGFNSPFHPDDDYLICTESGGRCPPCGDNVNDPFPHDHEAGGKWAKGIIVETYKMGEVIDIFANITKSHGGFMEFKLCPNNDITSPVQQECLDQYPLDVITNRGISKSVPLSNNFNSREEIRVKLQLPKNLECSQCVLQMTQHAEQFRPNIVMFRNCADISITKRGQANVFPEERNSQEFNSNSRFQARPNFFRRNNFGK